MRYPVPTRAPFSFAQTLAFIRRFPANHGEYIIGDDWITAAIAVGDRAVPFTLRAKTGTVPISARSRLPAVQRADTDDEGEREKGPDPFVAQLGEKGPDPFVAQLEVELPEGVSADAIVPRIATWIGADDDLGSFYAIAEKDPPMHALVRELYGLHHVAFMTLAEIAVYCVMMQRAPISIASRLKSRFLDRFGLRVQVGERDLRAMPELPFLASLAGDAIADAIGHRVKGPKIATVVRGVAALGETFLRTAPYATARDALLEIPGVGPFSAGAILLRGLGRMDELPPDIAAEEARELYGEYNAAAIAKRYGAHIGYWSFYLKTGVARMHR